MENDYLNEMDRLLLNSSNIFGNKITNLHNEMEYISPLNDYCIPAFAVADVISFNPTYYSELLIQNPSDWNSFTQIIQDKGTISTFLFPGKSATSFLRMLSSIFYSFGGGYTDIDNNFNIVNEGNINGLNLIKSWFDENNPICELSTLDYSEEV